MKFLTLFILFFVHVNAEMVEMSLKEMEQKGYVLKEYTVEEFEVMQKAEKLKEEAKEREREQALARMIPKEEAYTSLKDEDNISESKKIIADNNVAKVDEISDKHIETVVAEIQPVIVPIKKSLSEIITQAITNYMSLTSNDLGNLKNEIIQKVTAENIKNLDAKAVKAMPMTKANLQELLVVVNELKL